MSLTWGQDHAEIIKLVPLHTTSNFVATPHIDTDDTIMVFDLHGFAQMQPSAALKHNGQWLMERAAKGRRRLAAQPTAPSLGCP